MDTRTHVTLAQEPPGGETAHPLSDRRGHIIDNSGCVLPGSRQEGKRSAPHCLPLHLVVTKVRISQDALVWASASQPHYHERFFPNA